MLQIVIPLAGRAERFQERGYTFPKPLVEIGSQSMIEVVLRNLAPPDPYRFIFICRKEHIAKFYLDDMLRLLEPESAIVSLENETAGALCSVLLAIDQLDPNDELLIANGDQFIGADPGPFYASCREPGVDGCIMTFSATHPRWSFARVDSAGNVTAVAEKRPISRQATTGIYYFRTAASFLAAAESMVSKGLTTGGQFFVAPVYNELILSGHRITAWHLPDGAMHSLGTPEDFEGFVQWQRTLQPL